MPKPLAILALAALWTLSGCQSASLSSFGEGLSGADEVSTLAYFPDDELIAQGRAQFLAKNYGKSYALYKKSVEVFPQDASAWLGLAASADRIGRFDTADAAYAKLAPMLSDRPEYYNNLGYSHLLRGDLETARRHFLQAYRMAPENATVANNLQLLRGSVSMAARS